MLYRVGLIKNSDEIRRLYDFIKRFPLDYPGYESWLEKCFRELNEGYKKAFVCGVDSTIIGEIIFQPHKEIPDVLEIKNIRVEPEYQGRKVFSRLLDKTEEYAVRNKFRKIICDTHSNNDEMINVLRKNGFVAEREECLYDDRLETILIKPINDKKFSK